MMAPPEQSDVVTIGSPTSAQPSPVHAKSSDDTRRLRQLGLLSVPALRSVCANARNQGYVIDKLVPKRSVNISVGDSGIGKTALHYMQGICVAAGIPFLGYKTEPGRVIYFDHENGLNDMLALATSLSQYLGLSNPPDNFLLKPFDPNCVAEFEDVIGEAHPALCIIDSLRSHNPEAEERNQYAAQFLCILRGHARKYDTAFQLIHHTKKPGDKGCPWLETATANEWLLEACGARALINQTDVRIGIATPQSNASGEIALVVKGFARMAGETGPWHLERVCDDDSSPLGYRLLRGISLLMNPDHQKAYRGLPDQFTFKQAKEATDST